MAADPSRKSDSAASSGSRSTLSHFDSRTGRAKMVDVGGKPTTERAATARGLVRISAELAQVLKAGTLEKGDAFTVAKAAGILAAVALGGAPPVLGHGSGAGEATGQQDQHMEGGHHGGATDMPGTLDEMREMHQGHEHGHDFEAMEEMSPEQRNRVMALMHEVGVAMPPMNPERGRNLFTEKGCVACHSVNGVGGDLGPALDAADMPRPMNAFEFAARMWRGAEAMTALQNDLLGEVISLDGQDLADLVAFAHDAKEQARLTEDQIPERYRTLIGQ